MSGKVIIVLGMHRSYTSLVSSWLHHNGILMYEEADAHRVNAHCEDPEILEFHEAVLHYHGMNAINAREPFSDPQHLFNSRAEQIWQKRSARNIHWGWKEPRTCVLYQSFWSTLAAEAKIIMVYRHYTQVVESLLERKIRNYIQNRPRLYSALEPGIRWWFGRHRWQHDQTHLNCWNYYNQLCQHIAKSKKKEDLLVISADQLIVAEDRMRTVLREQWDISLKTDYRMQDLYQPSTIKNIHPTDAFRPDLLREADEIFNAWQHIPACQNITSSATQ